MHSPPISPELALRAFDAGAAFSLALAELQEQVARNGSAIPEALSLANQHGFSWLFRPCGNGQVEAVLRHSGGAEEKAIGDKPLHLILGLLGVYALLPVQAAEPDNAMQVPLKDAEAPVQPAAGAGAAVLEAAEALAAGANSAVLEAAEALAAATGGEVIDDDAEVPGRAQDDPLTDAEREAAVAMVKAMDSAKRKQFAIAFRHAFEVPATERAVAPLIQQFRHLEFVDRFTGEAAGVVKP